MTPGRSSRFDIVIIGGGQAGLQTVMSLVDAGYAGSVLLVGDEAVPPYQRPPLSKAYLDAKLSEDSLVIQTSAYFQRHGIELWLGETAVSIERDKRSVAFSDGREVLYGRLVLAVGASPRRLSDVPEGLSNVFHIRKLHEAAALKAELGRARKLVVVGGGFLGLEVAALAAARGADVAIVEATQRLLSRSASAPVSETFDRLHRDNGIVIHTECQAAQLLHDGEKAHTVVLSSGQHLPADMVLVSIGVVPNVELARRAGLAIENGIRVDDSLTTEDASIYAIGDCASFPYRHAANRRVRVESVQNALDQARAVAAGLLGTGGCYDQVPVFWTEQFGNRLQVAGIPLGSDRSVARGAPGARSFSVYRFEGERLMAVESVNAPGDHMLARKLLHKRISPTVEQAADPDFNLKSLLDATLTQPVQRSGSQLEPRRTR